MFRSKKFLQVGTNTPLQNIINYVIRDMQDTKKESKMRNKITSSFVADGYERQTLKILSQCFGGNISAAIRYAIMNIAPPTDEQVEQYLISENPTWSDAVESMIELRKNGFSFAQIANVLNNNGCTTKRGKEIKAFTVLRALRSKNEQ